MNALRIDAIKPTRKGRYALFSNGEFLFSLDAETLAKSDIVEGSSLSGEELSFLKDASLTRKAKDQALRYLARRAYGEQELYNKLCLRYDEHSCAAAVAAMRELGMMDDELFAAQRSEAMLERGKSSREVRHTLESLGIARETIDQALEQLEPDDAAAALSLLQRQYKEKLAAGKRQQVMAALARRGFAHGDIRRTVEATLAQIEMEAAETQWGQPDEHTLAGNGEGAP